jgi:predicted MPP superfamily phosphohydrolase
MNTLFYCDLLPGKTYQYHLDGSPDYRFNTPEVTTENVSFAVGSDAHFGATDNRKDMTLTMAAQIASPENQMHYFFSLGDLVEFGFREEQWQEAFHNLYPAMSNLPTLFVAGNHDTLFTGVNRYKSHFLPQSSNSQPSDKLWCRIDVGKAHFLVLDLEWSAERFTSDQAMWLEEQLRDIPREDWKIVLSHSYYYGSGSTMDGWPWYDNPETIQRITPLFEKYAVDLVFSGHNHQLELLQKSNITYVICGGLGGIPDPLRTHTSPFSQWYAAGQYGFVTVSLSSNEAHLDFRNADYCHF